MHRPLKRILQGRVSAMPGSHHDRSVRWPWGKGSFIVLGFGIGRALWWLRGAAFFALCFWQWSLWRLARIRRGWVIVFVFLLIFHTVPIVTHFKSVVYRYYGKGLSFPRCHAAEFQIV